MNQRGVVLVRESEGQRWRIELEDFADFEQRLGMDVVNAFSRCFVHTDRLTSLKEFWELSERHYRQDSWLLERDRHTIVWFAVGTLRELATAIRDVRAALAKRGMLNPSSEPWIMLRDIEKRWEDDPLYRKMRNVVAFHVDPEVVTEGLQLLSRQGRVVAMEGEGPKEQHSWLKLGLEALYMGCDLNADNLPKFMSAVGNDLRVTKVIQEAFILALEAAKVPFGVQESGA